MAAGGKKKKHKKYEKKDGERKKKPSLDGTEQTDTSEVSGVAGIRWDQDMYILVGAITVNVCILSAASVFWILYATCGSGLVGASGVSGPATAQTASSSVTPTSTTTPRPTPDPDSSGGAGPPTENVIATSSTTPPSTIAPRPPPPSSTSKTAAPATEPTAAPTVTPASTISPLPPPPPGSGTGTGEAAPAAGGAGASGDASAGSPGGDSSNTDPDAADSSEFKCGVPEIKPDLKKGRIVGGSEAVPYSWPYTVGLGFVVTLPWNPSSTRIVQSCGATLISYKHALSAAHCFDGDLDIKQTYSIFARLHDANTYKDVLIKEVETVHVHPLNNLASGSPYLQYDFAVLTLVEELEPEAGVNIACLPPLRVEKPEGTICWAAGWGVTQDTGADGLLKQVAIDIVSDRTCKMNFVPSNLKESSFCAGTTPGQDTCQGDSGGPLYCLDDGKWTVYGVTSYGPIICGSGPMAAYGAVSFNIEWICCYTPSLPPCAGIKCLRSGENRG